MKYLTINSFKLPSLIVHKPTYINHHITVIGILAEADWLPDADDAAQAPVGGVPWSTAHARNGVNERGLIMVESGLFRG